MLSAAAPEPDKSLFELASLLPQRWPGVGTGLYTQDKLACVDGWLDILTKMTRGILQRFTLMPRQYTVIDLNSGPGRYLLADGECVDGTPLLIMRRLVIRSCSGGPHLWNGTPRWQNTCGIGLLWKL